MRSPKASEGQGGALGEAEALRRGNTVGVRDQVMDLVASQGLQVSRQANNLLPTVKARDAQAEGYEAGLRRSQPQVGTIVKGIVDGDKRVTGLLSLLPTPNTMEHLPARTPEKIAESKQRTPGGYANLRESVVNDLMPTPTTMDAKATNNPTVTQKFLDEGRQTCLTYQVTLLPTPLTTDAKGSGPNDRGQLRNNRVLFPTPTTIDSRQGNNEASFNRNTPALGAMVHLLPTPVASEGVKATAAQGSEEKAETGQVWLTNVAYDFAVDNGLPVPARQGATVDLMGTPRTSSANGATARQVEANAPKARIEDQVLATSWGKFEPAIRRWEQTLGRPAPAPTKPDGKDGAHRLSSKFTEWMMGLPDGWITDCGLSRNEELKACGNGVVPQQAELALRILLEGLELPSGGGASELANSDS